VTFAATATAVAGIGQVMVEATEKTRGGSAERRVEVEPVSRKRQAQVLGSSGGRPSICAKKKSAAAVTP
jgi:hypothetical protein